MSALPQASAVPVYSAVLPWLGPVLGPWQEGDPVVPVGAVSDPVLGKALAVAFVPVRRARERLDPVRRGDAIVAWLAPCHGDKDGCLRIDAPRAWWDGVDGVLMLLVYDYSSIVDDQVPATLEAQLARFAPTLKLATGPLGLTARALGTGHDMLVWLRRAG